MSIYGYLHDFISPNSLFYPVLQMCSKGFFESEITKKLLIKYTKNEGNDPKERCKHLSLTMRSDTFRFVINLDLANINDRHLVSKAIKKAEFILRLCINLSFFKTFDDDPDNLHNFIKKNIITLAIDNTSGKDKPSTTIYLHHLMRVLNVSKTIEKLSLWNCHITHEISFVLERNTSIKFLYFGLTKFYNDDFPFVDMNKFTNLRNLRVSDFIRLSIVLPTENHYIQCMAVPISVTKFVDANNKTDENFMDKFQYLSCLRYLSSWPSMSRFDDKISEFFINNVIVNQGSLKLCIDDKWDHFKKGDKLEKLDLTFGKNLSSLSDGGREMLLPECERLGLHNYRGPINFHPSLRSLELGGGNFVSVLSSESKKLYFDGFKRLVNLENFTLRDSNLSISSVINAEFISCLPKTVKTVSIILNNTTANHMAEYDDSWTRIELIDASLLFFDLVIDVQSGMLELHLKGELKTSIKIKGIISKLTCEKEHFDNNLSKIQKRQNRLAMVFESSIFPISSDLFKTNFIHTSNDMLFHAKLKESSRIYDMFKYDDQPRLFKTEYYEISNYVFILNVLFMTPKIECKKQKCSGRKFIFVRCTFGDREMIDSIENHSLINCHIK